MSDRFLHAYAYDYEIFSSLVNFIFIYTVLQHLVSGRCLIPMAPNAKLSLPAELVARFVPTTNCWPKIYGQTKPSTLILQEHDGPSCSYSASNGTGNAIDKMVPIENVNQETITFFNEHDDANETRNLNLEEIEHTETKKTASCFSGMISRAIRSIRKKFRRSRSRSAQI